MIYVDVNEDFNRIEEKKQAVARKYAEIEASLIKDSSIEAKMGRRRVLVRAVYGTS